MHLNPSSETGPQSPNGDQHLTKRQAEEIWRQLVGIYNEVAEDPHLRPALGEEMSWSGLGQNPDSLQSLLDQADPQKAVERYREVNPQINLEQIEKEDPYNVVAGLVNLWSIP
jgi:hypothetical protein